MVVVISVLSIVPHII